jgi:hypothetical protein
MDSVAHRTTFLDAAISWSSLMLIGSQCAKIANRNPERVT